jgi:hypothetical protein
MHSLVPYHLFAILLAAISFWTLRRELAERPASALGWAIPPVLSIVIAAILLIVSPGKRFELWAVAIVLGFGAGLGMGVILKAIKDYERGVVKAQRTWDGFLAAGGILFLTIARIITSDLMNRPSGKFGVLGAAATFLACYLTGRALTLWFYTAPRSIHLDMTADGKRKAG